MTTATYPTCDACGHEVSGYSRKDLQAAGWVWHDVTEADPFVMCGDCEHAYEQRRAEATA